MCWDWLILLWVRLMPKTVGVSLMAITTCERAATQLASEMGGCKGQCPWKPSIMCIWTRGFISCLVLSFTNVLKFESML